MQNSAFPIEVKPSAVHGYGVFATRPIQKDEVIEQCPVLLLENYYPELTNYIFKWAPAADGKKRYAIPLGYGCLYNHSSTPNASWDCDVVNRKMIFVALQAIPIGQEIMTYYGDTWFAIRGMKAFETKDLSAALLRQKLKRMLPRIIIAVLALITLKLALSHFHGV